MESSRPCQDLGLPHSGPCKLSSSSSLVLEDFRFGRGAIRSPMSFILSSFENQRCNIDTLLNSLLYEENNDTKVTQTV